MGTPTILVAGNITLSSGFTYSIGGRLNYNASGLITVFGNFGILSRSIFRYTGSGLIQISGHANVYRIFNVGPHFVLRFKPGDIVYDFLLRELTVIGIRTCDCQIFYKVRSANQEFELPSSYLFSSLEIDEIKNQWLNQRLIYTNAYQDIISSPLTPTPQPGSKIINFNNDPLLYLKEQRDRLAEALDNLDKTVVDTYQPGSSTVTVNGENGLQDLIEMRDHLARSLVAVQVASGGVTKLGIRVIKQENTILEMLKQRAIMYLDQIDDLQSTSPVITTTGKKIIIPPKDDTLMKLISDRTELEERFLALRVSPVSSASGTRTFKVDTEEEMERINKVKNKIVALLDKIKGN